MIRPEAMAETLQQLSEIEMIVDLPVEDHADGVLLVPHRLRATLDIDDGKTAMAEENAGVFVNVIAISVGATVSERISHCPDGRLVSCAPKSGNSAHV
jgi:hypothetical protein